MAQIIEEAITIKVSQLVRDDAETSEPTFTADIIETLEQALSDMVGSGKVVEILHKKTD
jgi:hypothetical protein